LGEGTKDLNAEEEARLLELDGFIEKSTNKKSALPEQLKGTKNWCSILFRKFA
jgi:hypothetical protein